MPHSIISKFYIKTSGLDKDKKVPIYLRISINGHRIDQSMNRFIVSTKWSADNCRLKGTASEARLLNNHLDAINNQVYTFEREMILDRKEISFMPFKDK